MGGALLGGLVFGSIGFVAFMYGKREGSIRALTIGVVLMAYPYFVANTLAMYVIGLLLTVSLFIFRD